MSMSKDTVEERALLQNPEALATVINAVLRRAYGDQIYDYDPVTTVLELREDFSVEPESAVIDRFCAMQVIMTSDAFFQKIDAFMSICSTLSSGSPSFDVFDPPSLEEVAWACTEVALNRELLPLSNTIRNYILTLLKADGLEEDQYPQIFREVLLGNQESEVEADHPNNQNIESYIDGRLKMLFAQMDKIPGLRNNELILARSLEETQDPTTIRNEEK